GFAALLCPLHQFHGAVDRDAFFIAGDEKRDRALRLAARCREVVEARRDRAGDRALHVDGAATIERAVLDSRSKRRGTPGRIGGHGHGALAAEHGSVNLWARRCSSAARLFLPAGRGRSGSRPPCPADRPSRSARSTQSRVSTPGAPTSPSGRYRAVGVSTPP